MIVEDWRPKYVSGKEIEDWQKGPTVVEYCRETGIRGWEIDSFNPSPNGLSIVFKRPLEK